MIVLEKGQPVSELSGEKEAAGHLVGVPASPVRMSQADWHCALTNPDALTYSSLVSPLAHLSFLPLPTLFY